MFGKRDQDNAINTVTLAALTTRSHRFSSQLPNQLTEAIPYRSIEKMKLDLGIYGSDAWTIKRLT
jgi:hypothetical protein